MYNVCLSVQQIKHLSAQTQLIMTQNILNSSIHYIAMHFNGWNAYFCDRVHSLMKRKVFFLAVCLNNWSLHKTAE